jgi:formate dehydrogenase major subunit
MSLNLIIDGQEIVAQDGIIILEAAKRAGISIPTLCHVQEKDAFRPCEVCAVEVKGQD